jgi:hypothetical protein
VEDGGDKPGNIAVVQAGDGLAQVDRDAAGKAGRQLEDTAFSLFTELQDVVAGQKAERPRR